MKHLRRWTVCLNNTEHDDQILKYVAVMARFYQPESLQLLHVIEAEEIPDILQKEYSDIHEPEVEFYYNLLEEKSRNHLSGIANTTTVVRKGKKLRSILEFVYEDKSDLIFLGRDKRRGTIMKKVTRKSSASVMIIPEDSSLQLDHVLVATDFSPHSNRALQIGSGLSLAFDIPRVSALHIYNDASNHINESVETSFEVNQLLQKRAVVNDKIENFVRIKLAEQIAQSEISTEVEQTAVATPKGTKKSEALVQWVKDSDVDLVILGAKGQSSAEAFFLGSFAEDVYTRLNHQLILLYKQQGENTGFLKLLFGNNN